MLKLRNCVAKASCAFSFSYSSSLVLLIVCISILVAVNFTKCMQKEILSSKGREKSAVLGGFQWNVSSLDIELN